MADDFDDFFKGLPSDSYAASYELLSRIEKKIINRGADEAGYSTACGLLAAFYEANGFKIPDRLSGGYVMHQPQAPRADDIIEKARETWRLQFEAYRAQIMANRSHAVKRAAAKSFSLEGSDSFGYAVLSSDEKSEVHKHIDEIRKIIDNSKLDDRKKNKLFSRLAELSKEVNRNGTATDGFFAFASELGFCLGDFAKQARPLFKEVKDILKIVTKARARQENAKLPPGDEVLSLPAPNEG